MVKSKQNKSNKDAYVDSSYTVFFIFFCFLFSILFINIFPRPEPLNFWLPFGMAILVYLIHDISLQLYRPGQALLVAFSSVTILPAIIAYAFSWYGGTIGIILIWPASLIAAGVCEYIYNIVRWYHFDSRVIIGLSEIDNRIDKSFIKLNRQQLRLGGYAGILFAFMIFSVYIAIAFAILNVK